MSTSTFPPGVRAPLTADNKNDHSGLVVVLASFYIVLTLASVLARVFSLHRKRIVQADDYVFAGLVAIAFTQASVVLAQVHYGWGTRTGPSSATGQARMLKAGYAADLLFIVALGFSKISTCLFYEALFSQLPRRIIRTILAATIIWTVTALFLVAIRCRDNPWRDISARCGSLFAHWQAVTALDVVTEVLLVAYSGWAVSTVQIASRKKLMVFLALGCRIVLIPLSALRLYYLKHQLSSQYPTLLGAYTTTTTEIYLSLSIVCQITSSFKFIVAVYEDKDGISYTDRYARSAYKSKSGTGVSTDSEGNTNRNFSYSYKHSHAGGDRARLVSDAHNEEGPSSSGLQILRSVQWSVVDEAIELDETTRPPAAAQPVYQSLRY